MRITFLGAAGEVTGSCFLVAAAGARFLVECGMFQGGRDAYRRNLSALALPFPVKALDFVVLTHAHLDHSGLLPRLTALGYRGPIHATPATCDLLEVLLLDSAHIQEKETEWENRHHQARYARRGWERAPLYTVTQARDSLRQLRPCAYDTELSPHAGIRLAFRDAGHILGSAILELWLEENGRGRKLVFSGDLGQPARPVLRDPTPIDKADFLVVESTYGNRLHKSLADTEAELVAVLTDTLERKGGNVIMPAFAVGRTQEVIFVLVDLARRGRLPPLSIYVDSPMALSATELTFRHLDILDEHTRELIDWHRHHADRPRIRFVQEVEESMALNRIKGGAVILSASGMCDAGRIKHHLRHNLPRPESSVVITGFQAAGTLGRRLVDGARRVRIFGEEVTVRADIHTIGGLSAHADQAALLGWLGHFRRPPSRTFVVHGESETIGTFADIVRMRLGWPDVTAPRRGEAFFPG
ncbi:MAG: MBL fold metallo-hydrolase [Rhodocyclaceae bacterium]|nr:MBL fold metallo-hydrolase [Rhodocyclaceae bacterium]